MAAVQFKSIVTSQDIKRTFLFGQDAYVRLWCFNCALTVNLTRVYTDMFSVSSASDQMMPANMDKLQPCVIPRYSISWSGARHAPLVEPRCVPNVTTDDYFRNRMDNMFELKSTYITAQGFVGDIEPIYPNTNVIVRARNHARCLHMR